MKIRLYCNKVKLDDATWADVEAVLPELKKEAFFALTIMPEPETGPDELEIQSADGNYMPAMGTVGGHLYSFHNPAVSGAERVEIGGYECGPTSVTQDYDFIVRMIKEFYHTGNVPEEWWEEPQPTKSE